MAGIYIHIPFCKQACHYCNFHFSTSLEYKSEMLDAIVGELKMKAGLLNQKIETIYLGGGTPSLLAEKELWLLFDTIDSNYDLIDKPEITLEANPDDVNPSFVQLIKYTPINRLSLGIQSFFDEDLQYMNRAHAADDAHQALRLFKEAGIENITADLIYGMPTLSTSNWIQNIDLFLFYNIPHISCYQLTVEPKTPLHALISQGKLAPPNDQSTVEQFYLLLDKMEANGYEAYEISNFAKPGYRSRHNSSYWQGHPYIGIGPSAHSYFDNSRRWNTRVNKRYMEMIASGTIPETIEELTHRDQYNEYLLTRLRTIEGVSRQHIVEYFPSFLKIFDSSVTEFLKKQWMTTDGQSHTLTREGKIWTDKISSELMA